MRKDLKDVQGTNFIRSVDANIAIKPNDVQHRWRGYFEEMLNVENLNVLENTPIVLGPIKKVSNQEVSLALRFMKSGNASGPSEVTTEMYV